MRHAPCAMRRASASASALRRADSLSGGRASRFARTGPLLGRASCARHGVSATPYPIGGSRQVAVRRSRSFGSASKGRRRPVARAHRPPPATGRLAVPVGTCGCGWVRACAAARAGARGPRAPSRLSRRPRHNTPAAPPPPLRRATPTTHYLRTTRGPRRAAAALPDCWNA